MIGDLFHFLTLGKDIVLGTPHAIDVDRKRCHTNAHHCNELIALISIITSSCKIRIHISS